MPFENVYEDPKRAEAYAKLEFPGTYYLAYRDLPEIILAHVKGRSAIDFGCGTGRSTRFLRKLGFAAIGIDISAGMIAKARELDPDGDYHLVNDAGLSRFANGSCDLVLSCFTFDNIPTMERKIALFRGLGALLGAHGRIVSVVSSPEIYMHEWASFTTKNFPENRLAECGDKVRIIMTDVEDRRPVEDIIWTESGYTEVYAQAGLRIVQTHKPLAHESEPFAWVNETRIAPWTVYVLEQQE